MNIDAPVTSEPWIARAVETLVEAARPWSSMSDEQLWSLMFAHTIPRAHHVWSDGFCPACKASVVMYEWKVAARKLPWKMSCPHCSAAFPTNDFGAYHRSGLDAHGFFDPALADRSLLFNADHPDPADPLHQYGVDDGNGVFIEDKRWLFVAAYMLYGYWNQIVMAGIHHLADAYAVTQNPRYAHQTLILLDRIADVFPLFDFAKQGWMYEKPGAECRSDGHVMYWCNNCEDVRQMAEAYGMIKHLADAPETVAFLAEKSRVFKTPMPKKRGADIRENIEQRIFSETLANPIKYRSNFPRAEIARVAMLDAIGSDAARVEADEVTESLIRNTARIDGVTGEKGLPTYSAYVITSLATFLTRQERRRPGFIREWVEREPNLRKTWRFFLDTRCIERYYPGIGDAMWFGAETPELRGVALRASDGVTPTASPSHFSFLNWMYEATGDADYLRALYEGNGNRLDDLPRDVTERDPAGFREKVGAVLQRVGTKIKLPSVNKTEWHLAILRSGEDESARALWIDYDTGGNHGHMDGMNVGLFAHGLDLIPDFGYPPVQFGGWSSPKSRWYYQTAAHHTVVIDGRSQPEFTTWKQIDAGGAGGDNKKRAEVTRPVLTAGKTTLWRDQPPCQIVRIDGREIYQREDIKQYERTLMLIDVDATRFYVVDVFRVVGGSDHALFTHGAFSTLETAGLKRAPAADFGHETLMRNFETDAAAVPGWSATFQLSQRNLKMTRHDLTNGASASTCEAWINGGHYAVAAEAWIPRVMVRRQGSGALSSCFVSVLEVYEDQPTLKAVRRLPLTSEQGEPLPDSCVGLELTLADGVADRVYLADTENPLGTCPWGRGADKTVMVDAERKLPITRDVVWVRAGEAD